MVRFKIAWVTVLFAVVAACSSNSPTASNGGSSGASGSTNATGGTGAAGGFGGAAGASGGVGGLSGGTCDAGAPLTVTSNHTPDTTVGASYSYSYQATGGCPPYTWTVTSGTLPPGLSLGQDGTLTGSATTIGTYSFTVQCCDSAGSCVSNGRGIVVTAGSGSGGSGAGGSAGSGATGGSGGSGAAQGLLPGCTVVTSGVAKSSTSKNQPTISCPTPSGWTLVAAEGFEGGTLADSTNENIHATSIVCNSSTPAAHTGSCYLEGQIFTDDDNTEWWITPGVIGSSHEIYVSWWEYYTSGVTHQVGQDFGEAWVQSENPTYGPGGEGISINSWAQPTGSPVGSCLNGSGPGGDYNCHNSQSVVIPNGYVYYHDFWGANIDQTPGRWVQWELHLKANTPNNSDGEFELYLNGQLVNSGTNVNLNASVDMTGMEVMVGSTYTAVKFTDSTGTVCEVPDTSGSTQTYCDPFSACSPCPIPPNFSRDWDDIIVLKK